MSFFPCAHAGHPLWQHAVQQVIVQLRAQISMQMLKTEPCLGLVYVSAPYTEHAAEVVAALSKALPHVRHWVGCAAHSVLAGDMDYGASGALAVMLPCLREADYQVFSDLAPWQQTGPAAHTTLLHGDAALPSLHQHVQQLHQQIDSCAMLGGLCAWQGAHSQWAWGNPVAGHMPASIGGEGVQMGGLSGVAFAAGVECLSIGMQGCKPLGNPYTMTRVDGDVLLELNGRPALQVLFGNVDWGEVLSSPRQKADAIWEKLQQILLAVTAHAPEVRVRSIAPLARVLRVSGIDPLRQGVALDGAFEAGRQLSICQQDAQAARTDMRRACAELWETLTCDVAQTSGGGEAAARAGRSICGAVYIRSLRRHRQPRMPQIDSELQLIRHALGPVPLLGFTSSYEVEAGELHQLSAQLLVFTQPLQALS